LGSTTLNLTTLGLVVGQTIHIGGLTSTNQFAGGKGYARVTSIAAGALGLDKLDSTLVTDTGSGKAIDLLFGSFIRNVSVDSADFLYRTFQFELAYPNLDNPSGDMYEYAKGNLASEMDLSLPLAEKALLTWGFMGSSTDNPTSSRKTNAASPLSPIQTGAFGTASDIARLRLTQDTTGITTYFKALSAKLNNNVGPEKALGTLGAAFLNYGNFHVDIDSTAIFTDAAVVAAVRSAAEVSMDWVLRNSDGALIMDIPSLQLGDATRSFPVNQSVDIKLSGQAFVSPIFGYSLGVSTIPAVPHS
jgi:hypothetical protein